MKIVEFKMIKIILFILTLFLAIVPEVVYGQDSAHCPQGMEPYIPSRSQSRELQAIVRKFLGIPPSVIITDPTVYEGWASMFVGEKPRYFVVSPRRQVFEIEHYSNINDFQAAGIPKRVAACLIFGESYFQ